MNTEVEQVAPQPTVERAKAYKLEKPTPIWFYRKRAFQGEVDEWGNPKEYEVFACQEEEAARLDPVQFEQVGASDGVAYAQHLRTNIRPNVSIPLADAQAVMREAFKRELEVARGHFKQPRRVNRHIGGVSADVGNPQAIAQEFINGA